MIPADVLPLVDDWTANLFVATTSAVLGAIVAWTAYRGYRRNDSERMRYLAIGVAFLTVVSFVGMLAVDLLPTLTDVHVILWVTACQLVGLLAIAKSLGRV